MKICIFFLWIMCFAPTELPAAQRPDEEDRNVCDVQPTEYNKHTIDTVPGADHVCCLCPAGKFLSQSCAEDDMTNTVCLPCQFIDGNIDQQYFIQFGPHNKSACLKAKGECKSTEYRIQGNRTADAQCKERTKCESGFGVEQFATPTSDTVCTKCDEGYESPTLSATETCTRIKIVTTTKPDPPPTSVVVPTKVPTTTLQTTFTPSKSSGVVSPGEIAGIIVGSILGIVLVILLGVYIHRKCRPYRDDEVDPENGDEENEGDDEDEGNDRNDEVGEQIPLVPLQRQEELAANGQPPELNPLMQNGVAVNGGPPPCIVAPPLSPPPVQVEQESLLASSNGDSQHQQPSHVGLPTSSDNPGQFPDELLSGHVSYYASLFLKQNNGDSHQQPSHVNIPSSSCLPTSSNSPGPATSEPSSSHTPGSQSQSSQDNDDREHFLSPQSDGNVPEQQPTFVDIPPLSSTSSLNSPDPADPILTPDIEQPGTSNSDSGMQDPLYFDKMNKIRDYLDGALLDYDSVSRLFRYITPNDEQFLTNARNCTGTISEYFNRCHNKLLEYGWQRYSPDVVINYFKSKNYMLHVNKIESLLKQFENEPKS
uniref:Tumor necrosis factor receptor superfamily member 21-like n=1 Tax=Phallusia mammillata TaxID=59560 RepID=A0A6F9DVI2_9ASCI|nr:tumor necrosis factor receptor superfamily member 21-like [Phallusia mammillata]